MQMVCADIIQHVFQVVMKQNAVIEHLKQKKTMTPAEREENQRCVCVQCSFCVFICEDFGEFYLVSKVSSGEVRGLCCSPLGM